MFGMFATQAKGDPTMSATLFEGFFPPRPRRSGFWTRLAVVRQSLAAWRRRTRARRALLAADDRMLADLGISRAQASFSALRGPLD